MSKISQYLNEHLLGEVTCADLVRERFSTDGSILTIKPELIVSPRITNDIRKVARFTWQLAEKGHIMPLITRGGGTDQTGAAIGSGIIINTLAHLNNVIFINLKDKDQFVHTQPGITFAGLNEVLKSHGIFIPNYPTSAAYSTIGGAIANNACGSMCGQYGQIGDLITRLEVVLANGDIIETGRVNKHELDKKKGLQTFEGEIYRKIDAIIEDNEQLIKDKIAPNCCENIGYTNIAKVKQRDGSFDLTPLFVGSQGTLGIISEIVIKTVFYSNEESIIAATFDSPETARDSADLLAGLKPSVLEVIDGDIFEKAKIRGKKFIFDDKIGALVYVSFNDFGAKARHHKIKRALKILSKTDAKVFSSDEFANEELRAIFEASSSVIISDAKDETYPSLIDGASVPADRREEYIVAMTDLAAKHHIDLPLQINWLNGVVHARTPLNLHTTSDKQKVFKLMADYSDIITKYGGNLCVESSEGRLKTAAAYAHIEEDITNIYNQVRLAFDPFGTLNPGVKQPNELKTLVSQLNPSADIADIAKYAPLN